MVYQWKDGACFKADANKCKAEIDALPENTRKNIVAFARNRKTELHKCFEWNDTKAAEKYRLNQAGEIQRSIILVSVNQKGEEAWVRVYEKAADSKNSPYRDVSGAINDNFFRQIIINRVTRNIKELEYTLKAYQRFFKNPESFIEAIQVLKREGFSA